MNVDALSNHPLVIVGPTASGKTALANDVGDIVNSAGADDGSELTVEIVSADAMAIYRSMDIGTAKPTPAEQAKIKYHCIDVVEPSESYTVARFQAEADAALEDIKDRGAVPIVVGGTGLYIQAVVDNFTMPGQFPEVKAAIEAEPDTEALWHRLNGADPAAAAKMLTTNRRRIVRALEVTEGSGQPFSSFGPGVDHYPMTPFVLVGLEIDRELLDSRIDQRYGHQLDQGFLDEVAKVLAAGPSKSASQALGYKELFAHLQGRCSLDEALAEAKRRTRKFARRQQRWFRRDPRIQWFDATAENLASIVADHWSSVAESNQAVSIPS